MKILLTEIFDPVKDFYSMRWNKKKEIYFFTFIPFLVSVIFLACDFSFHTERNFSLDDFMLDMLNQLVTVLTLFISFSMAYLSILITSSSNNVDDLKRKESQEYSLGRGKTKVTLYQIMMDEITYTLVIEIFFLLAVFFQKFLYLLCNDLAIKIMIAINIGFLVHVLFLMMITVKNIYFAFWRSK